MNKDLLNILSHSNKDIDNQKLMDYLSGKLSEEDKHEVERWMAESDFSDDAMEGLSQFRQPRAIEQYVDDLHKSLNQQLLRKKKRREKRKLKETPWIYLAAFIILLLAIITYVIVKKMGT